MLGLVYKKLTRWMDWLRRGRVADDIVVIRMAPGGQQSIYLADARDAVIWQLAASGASHVIFELNTYPPIQPHGLYLLGTGPDGRLYVYVPAINGILELTSSGTLMDYYTRKNGRSKKVDLRFFFADVMIQQDSAQLFSISSPHHKRLDIKEFLILNRVENIQ